MDWNAQNYQKTCGRVTEHGEKLVDILRNMPCGKVLDIGCGTGVLTHKIAELAEEVIGIDLSPAMVEKAKAMYSGIEFIVMDACEMPWENYFDTVFSNAVLHFIREQDILLDNINKVLVPGGLFICEFGASGNMTALLDAVSRACLKRGKPYSLRFYYPEENEYRLMLEKHGFTAEDIYTYDLDTRLTEGEPGLRNWINQIFNIEMDRFGVSEREDALTEIESALRPAQWDGENWHLFNRRLRVAARKNGGIKFENKTQ